MVLVLCQGHYQFLLIILLMDLIMIKDDKLIFKYIDCNKNNEEEFDKKLTKKFKNKYEFCNKDINKLILLLRKGSYSNEYTSN